MVGSRPAAGEGGGCRGESCWGDRGEGGRGAEGGLRAVGSSASSTCAWARRRGRRRQRTEGDCIGRAAVRARAREADAWPCAHAPHVPPPHLRGCAPLRPHERQQLQRHRVEVALVCGQPLGGQLLEQVVQHQVHAALRELLLHGGARRLRLALLAAAAAGTAGQQAQQRMEQVRPLVRVVRARHLGQRHGHLNGHAVVFRAPAHQAQHRAAQVRLLGGRQQAPAVPVPRHRVLEVHGRQPPRAGVVLPAPDDLGQAGAEARAVLQGRKHLLSMLVRGGLGGQGSGEAAQHRVHVPRGQRGQGGSPALLHWRGVGCGRRERKGDTCDHAGPSQHACRPQLLQAAAMVQPAATAAVAAGGTGIVSSSRKRTAQACAHWLQGRLPPDHALLPCTCRGLKWLCQAVDPSFLGLERRPKIWMRKRGLPGCEVPQPIAGAPLAAAQRALYTPTQPRWRARMFWCFSPPVGCPPRPAPPSPPPPRHAPR